MCDFNNNLTEVQFGSIKFLSIAPETLISVEMKHKMRLFCNKNGCLNGTINVNV